MIRFLLGLAAGIGLALLYAPASGRETRARLSSDIDEISQLPKRKAAEVAEITRRKAGDIGSDIGRKAAQSAVDAIEAQVLGRKQEG